MDKDSGIYVLVFRLDEERRVRVGRLGIFTFPRGWYTYTGSALKGLSARIRRHRSSVKRVYWHIDYLLEYASIERVAEIPTAERIECALHACLMSMKDCRMPVKGFGSSDCGCVSHLLYWGEKTPPANSEIARCTGLRA